MEKQGLTPKQITAVKRSIELGRTLQSEHPEIAEIYRNGCSLSETVEELNIMSEYDVGYGVAMSGVRYALAGHRCGFRVKSYDGFLSLEEIARLGREHMSMAGLELYKEGRGVHGRTKEEMSADSRKGGKISGRKAYEERKGVHAMTEEERREVGRMSAIARGLIPWSEEEKREAYKLSTLPDYRHGSNTKNGKIARELNMKYHDGRNVRNTNSISIIIRRYKKSLEAKVDGESQ